jgi:hypothetical protein
MIAGGLVGSLAGAGLFRLLQASGQIDLVIGLALRAAARLHRRLMLRTR